MDFTGLWEASVGGVPAYGRNEGAAPGADASPVWSFGYSVRMASESMAELFAVVSRIPEGAVAGYGAIGKSISRPVSGLVAGRWMAVCDPELPWWRVVGADGSIKTFGRSPDIGVEQRRRLEAEGVEFDSEGRVKAEFFVPFEALL